MKVLLITLVSFACLIWQTEQQECHTREVSLCSIPSLMAARASLIPKDEKALTNSCRMWKNEQKCIIKYEEKCLSDIHRMILDIALKQTRHLQNELCEQNIQMKSDFLKAAPCLIEVVKLTHETCMENTENMLYMMTGENLAEGITAGCCFYESFYNCFNNHLQKRCEKERIPVIEETSKIMHLDTLHSICRSHDPESEICTDILSRNVTNPSETSSYLTRMIMLFLRH